MRSSRCSHLHNPVEPSARLGQTVLLVEDNEDNRIMYSTVLRHVGYDVIEAEDRVRAVALARSSRPDLPAHALPDDREKGAQVGFTAYLAKPVEPRAVVAEVRRWIGGGESHSGD